MPFPLAAITVQMLEEAGLTLSDLQRTLSTALQDSLGPDQWGYVQDVIGDDNTGELIYALGGKLWKCSYTITKTGTTRAVTLATSKQVQVMPQMSYVKATGTTIESGTALAETTTFGDGVSRMEEAAEGSYTIKVIKAGQGSSAFYPKEVLKSQGPRIFRAGTKMYMDHATEAERRARPEGSVKNLAGVLTGNAYWDENGKKGPGLYAPIKVFADYQEQIASKAPHIAVSIRAMGTGETKDGVFTVKQFTHAESIDFVTEPGAGGAILTESGKPATKEKTDMERNEVEALLETKLAPLQATVTTLTESNTKLSTALSEAQATNVKLVAAGLMNEARLHIAPKLQTEKLPPTARVRVSESLLSGTLPTAADGSLDRAKLDEAYVAAVKIEADYIASIAPGGQVMNMGESRTTGVEVSDKDFRESLIKSAKDMGMSQQAAEEYADARQ